MKTQKKETAQLHVRIDPILYRDLKVAAAKTGQKLQDLVTTLLVSGLKKGGAR